MEHLLGSVASRQVFATHIMCTFPSQRSLQHQSTLTPTAECGTAASHPLASQTSIDSTSLTPLSKAPRELLILQGIANRKLE
jgi:hypothetical protein